MNYKGGSQFGNYCYRGSRISTPVLAILPGKSTRAFRNPTGFIHLWWKTCWLSRLPFHRFEVFESLKLTRKQFVHDQGVICTLLSHHQVDRLILYKFCSWLHFSFFPLISSRLCGILLLSLSCSFFSLPSLICLSPIPRTKTPASDSISV